MAELLGVSEEVVRQRLSRAHAKIREEVLRRFASTVIRTAPGAAFTAAVAGALVTAAPAASAAPPSLWETDGPVFAVAESGGTVYLGGEFDYVGPHTGSGVPLSSVSGAADPMFPPVEGGWVSTAVADGIGGW